MRNAGLEEAQAGLKIAGRNINNLRYAHDTTLMAESEEELKTLMMKVKEESGGGHCTWEEPAQFSVGRLSFSKNLSISSRLSIVLPYSCS